MNDKAQMMLKIGADGRWLPGTLELEMLGVVADQMREIERLRGLLIEAERLCMEYCALEASDALVDDWANNQAPNT